MTSILAIKTTVNTEFEGFLDSVIKSSHEIVQNRFYLHSEQIKETSVKLIHFD